MFILIIEDEKDEKLGAFLEYLNNNKDIQYILMEDEKSATTYIKNNASKIDGIITDLGLPFDSKSVEGKYNSFGGINIIDCMAVRNRRIPVIINSAAELDNTSKKRLTDIDYIHVECLAEEYVSNSLAVINMIKEMNGKAICVDEKKASININDNKKKMMTAMRNFYKYPGG